MRMLSHVCSSANYTRLQSAYRRAPPTDVLRLPMCSAYRRAPPTDVLIQTETALLKILNDVYQSSGSKNITLLAVLDISAAFDTVDIPTIGRRLEHSFGVTDTTQRWIKSYISNRAQFVKVGKALSLPKTCSF